jgi:hypothetical protein
LGDICARCGDDACRAYEYVAREYGDMRIPSYTGRVGHWGAMWTSYVAVGACDGCDKKFRTEKGLDRHIAWCERADEIDLVKRSERRLERKLRTEMDEKLAKMRQEMQQLALVAAPAPTQNAGIGINSGIGINNGIGIAITNNIAPWDPLNVDFERLKRIDSKFVPPSSVMDRSLLKANPTEALVKDHLQLDPPHNKSVLNKDAALGWDGVRFFDGEAYRRVEDPKSELDTRYQLLAREQLLHLEQNVARVIRLCEW